MSQSTPDKVLPRIREYGGEVIQTSLEEESEARQQEALDTTSNASSETRAAATG